MKDEYIIINKTAIEKRIVGQIFRFVPQFICIFVERI